VVNVCGTMVGGEELISESTLIEVIAVQ